MTTIKYPTEEQVRARAYQLIWNAAANTAMTRTIGCRPSTS